MVWIVERHWPGLFVSANADSGSEVDAGIEAWLAFTVSACTLPCLALSLSPVGPTAAAALGVQVFCCMLDSRMLYACNSLQLNGLQDAYLYHVPCSH